MPSIAGYSGDYDYSRYTPFDNTGYWDIFRSGFKNLRFNVQISQQIQLDATTAANLPGLAYSLYGDSSLWRVLLAFNGLTDPLSDVAVGIILQIPTKSQVIGYLSSQANNNPTTLTI